MSTKTSRTMLRWLGRSLAVVAAAAVVTACVDDSPVAPSRSAIESSPDAALVSEANQLGKPDVDLGTCTNLNVPAGNKLAFRTYAVGFQIYRWSGTSWAFVAPQATLYAGKLALLKVGTHYVGPTWEGLAGSKVVGAVVDRCTPDANAIPWLLLRAVSTDGFGLFTPTTFIQRVNTVGGLAPAAPGSVVGEEANVPYTTEYYFYWAK